MKSLAVFCVAAAAFVSAAVIPIRAQEVAGAAAVTGAGSTFAYPIVSRWAKGYQRWVSGGGEFPIAGSGLDDPPSAPPLDYEPSGSLGGTMRVRAGAVDFGASDAPIKSEELQRLGLVQFPIVIGGIVAVVNIDGVAPGQLKLTGPLLADIYLGKVQNWSDAAIKSLNPDLKLPDAKIVLVHRSDGSGTTFNFTDYLSKVSPEWRSKVSSDLLVRWPGGTGARGNEGVSTTVRNIKNSIGYVEFANALQNKLSYATLRNGTGQFVTPTPQSFQVAAASADWANTKDFDLLMTDVSREGAYPIVATVFAMMRKDAPAGRTRAALNFFKWSLEKGAKDAADLGYVPLPETLVAQVKRYWASNLKAGS
jgi:phosphate transport system substrate-binding protein